MKNSAKVAFSVFSSLFHMRKIVFEMVAVCLLSAPAFADLTAKSYITKGLIGHWDGIENVAYGQAHSSTATSWADIAGGGLSISLPTGAAFAENGVTTIRKNGKKTTAAVWTASKEYAAFKAANYTVEVAYDQTAEVVGGTGYANRGVMLSLGTDAYWMGVLQNNKAGFNGSFGTESTLSVSVSATTTLGQHTLSCSHDGTTAKVFFDDASKSAAKTGAASPTTAHGFAFNMPGYWSTSNGIDGVYHSIRFYDHALSDDDRAVNRAVDRVRYFGADPASVTLPTGWRFNTADGVKLEKQLTFSVKNGVGGTITVNGGDPTVEDKSVWVEQGQTTEVTLTVAADDGYAFLGWSGVDDEELKYETSVTVSVSEDVTAVFRKTDGSEPKTYSWAGAVNADWLSPASWRDEDGLRGVPAAHDSVTVPSGKSALLTAASPEYDAVTVAGTLTMTNWATCLNAGTVRIVSEGVLTCAAGGKTAEELSRVWVKCADLTVDAGGKINVDKKGYAGGAKKSGNQGYGPGGSVKDSLSQGASHGGYGGRALDMADYAKNKPTRLPYDDPSDPVDAGSSGSDSEWGAGNAGGGVVRIEASGVVTVNGSVTAAGGKTANSGLAGASLRDNAGAGGTVNIRCGRLAGSGTISANGGNGDNPESRNGLAGGGGRIAIRYDAALQTAAEVSGLRITASAGHYAKPNYSTTNVTADKDRGEADIGTLWFSDTKLVDALLGKGLTGQICGVADYETAGDLSFDYGHVRFIEEGVQVTVNGDLTFGGTDSRLEIGGWVATNRSTYADLWVGTEPVGLTVTGDLTLGGVSRLDVRAAEVATTTDFGAEVAVGGTMTVGSGCFVYAWSDIENGGSPRFSVGSLDVAAGGTFSADYRGYRGGYGNGSGFGNDGGDQTGAGPGGGYYNVGGGYGGTGGGHKPTWPAGGGFAYGTAEKPYQAGSGGCALLANGSRISYVEGGAGGGLISVVATGTVEIAGTVSANGDHGKHGINKQGGGGSGGAIYIACRRFIGGETAVLSAKGGSSEPNDAIVTGAGGGGRIAVWCGEPKADGTPRGRISSADEPLTPANVKPKHADAIGEFFQFLGSADAVCVDGGVTTGSYATEASNGKKGSTFFAYVGEKTGAMLLIR